MPRTIAPEDITGLLLAGGRGSRMGGVDKGLQPLQGRPLFEWVLARLQPQVGPLLINANRNLKTYAAQGLRVVSDADDSFAGPLAGLLAGLQACETEWLLSAPCDTPLLPTDLAERLAAAAVAANADLAVPISINAQDAVPGEPPRPQIQPVFCLLRASLKSSLAAYLQGGGRKIETWLRAQNHVLLPFDAAGDEQAFFNANHLSELQALQSLLPASDHPS
ncbi:molybdenum cofactor guanylyltransferase MobA [Paucibacter sp. KBW04]|uniref:molybdenum cofactor guanylyltransferase MobA n=1 Tax=Paucibacter sp. KBW04 TaxID=2153361 RepID=UPI000F58B710|nr:molybdenum cofactor guanylyltransferase MobA [Paucibacter sp. KBW04]RQO63266.1 molybdenum cofactor guanylyltransferase MobA [Paucibacter sp. KBW04]